MVRQSVRLGQGNDKGTRRQVKLSFAGATAADAAAIAALRTAVAEDLTTRYGRGPWSSAVTERSVLRSVERAVVIVARHQGEIVGRQLLGRAVTAARRWPAEAIRLDAYDADAGAGGFCRRYGFREVGRVTYRGTPLLYFERLL